MANETLSLTKYIKKLSPKFNKKLKKKSKSKRVYGLGMSGGPADVSDIGENIIKPTNLLCELIAGGQGAFTATVLSSVPNQKEEDEEPSSSQNKKTNKLHMARILFRALVNKPNTNRKEIIQQLEQKIKIPHSTAESYYQKIAKEMHITGTHNDNMSNDESNMSTDDTTTGISSDEHELDSMLDDESDESDEDDVDRTGIIRTVVNAHLIYKQQTETGSFEELWIYNIGKGNDELDIKRDILAGTDIPPKKTKSPDGSQSFTLTTMGNAQYLHLTGLQN